ncbi:hypothetical protein IMZ48_37970 [Candidatus Bathyarchaeota archaeon]|nr:hypothetical protein [Candidatus Bathyarchaeota archaeon]
MIFLGTPHRGSEYASVLDRVLRVSGVPGLSSGREYVKDITTGSTSTQHLNDEFEKLAQKLLIHSFYETLETSLGVSSALIVSKDSAILGRASPCTLFFRSPLTV